MEIDIIGIDEHENWPTSKRQNYEQLQIVTRRIIEKNKDVTNGFTEDLLSVVLVYAQYGTKEAKEMCWNVCKLSPKFNEEKLTECWEYASKDNTLKTNRKLWLICKNLDIDTTIKSEGAMDTAEELVPYLKPGVDPGFVLENGFYGYINGPQTGYYFRSGEKTFSTQSNFVIEPLMHVYSKGDNKRIIGINNGFKKAILDMPSRALISLDLFSASCYEEGNFMFWGSKHHLMRILNTINDKFPQCYELKTLGWQPEGFFAWNNYVYVPKEESLKEFSSLGIVEVKDTNYFSPSASDIYSNQRSEDDEYENDRYLTYIKSDVNLEQWAELFNKVYPAHSIYGIAFVMIGLFKDIIYKIDNNCPHLSAYGQKGSGKSKFAESINAVFLNDLLPFNLNFGTEFAFFTRLARFRNCVTWFDEFDDNAIKEDRFQSIKAAYDGAGRERGKGGNKNKTEMARVNSALLLTGQYLSTRDDNSALSRCIVLPFYPEQRTAEQEKNYENLKKLEKKGLTSVIIEILKYRSEFEKEYPRLFYETFTQLKELVHKANGIYQERILRNYTAVANCFRFFSDRIKFPFTFEQVMQSCSKDIIRLSTIISESDSLADFWNTVEFLLETGEIYEGYHFKISDHTVITIKKEGKEESHKFTKPTKLLFIRLTSIHKLYLEAHRKQTGKTGINLQSLDLYLSSAKGFVGKSSAQRFVSRDGQSTVTSCYVFDYTILNVSLERMSEPTKEQVQTEVHGHLVGKVDYREIAGKTTLTGRIRTLETYKDGEFLVKRELFTTIYTTDLQNATILETGQEVTITGQLKEQNYKNSDGENMVKRTMVADSIRLKTEQLEVWKPVDDVPEL